MIRSLTYHKGEKPITGGNLNLKRAHTPSARLFRSSSKTLKSPYSKHGPTLGLPDGATTTASPYNFSLEFSAERPGGSPRLPSRAPCSSSCTRSRASTSLAGLTARRAGGRGREGGCSSVGKCARAPARRPTPTPRLFFSGKRGASQDASFGRKLGTKASRRRVYHDRIRCFGAARCQLRTPRPECPQQQGGGWRGPRPERRGPRKVKGPSPREGAEVCRGERVSAEICVHSRPPPPRLASRWNSSAATRPTDAATFLPRRAPSEAGARLAGRRGPATNRPPPTPARHLWRKRPFPGLAALHADRPPPARTERGARFPPRPRGPSPLNWLQPAAAERGPRRGGGERAGPEGRGRGSRGPT